MFTQSISQLSLKPGDQEKGMVAVLEVTMYRKKSCSQCGHDWWPRVSDPKQCPVCKSKKWNVPKTTKPEEIESVVIYGDEHHHYRYHYHIDTDPSFSQSELLCLLYNALKTVLQTDCYDNQRGEWINENYRLTPDTVLRRKSDGYTDRILRFSDPEHIHIFFYTDEGRDVFKQALKQIFPNVAEFPIKEIDDSELDAMRERWRISGKYF